MRHLHIFYVHYNVEGKGNKSRPEWFDYEKCFVNLLNSIEGKSDISLHLVMDGKVEYNWINKYRQYYILHETEGGTIEKVTYNVYNYIKNTVKEPNDLIYILENDYLHVHDWVDKIRNLFTKYEGLEYISLYDHADKYFLPMYEYLMCKVVVTENHHWRSTPSTCGTYITTQKIFTLDYDDHIGVTVPVGDHHKWLFLNNTKGRSILTPIPGLSTHCMKGLESPVIDWENI